MQGGLLKDRLIRLCVLGRSGTLQEAFHTCDLAGVQLAMILTQQGVSLEWHILCVIGPLLQPLAWHPPEHSRSSFQSYISCKAPGLRAVRCQTPASEYKQRTGVLTICAAEQPAIHS